MNTKILNTEIVDPLKTIPFDHVKAISNLLKKTSQFVDYIVMHGKTTPEEYATLLSSLLTAKGMLAKSYPEAWKHAVEEANAAVTQSDLREIVLRAFQARCGERQL